MIVKVRLDSMIPEDNLEEDDEDEGMVSARQVVIEPKDNTDCQDAFGNISSKEVQDIGISENNKFQLDSFKKSFSVMEKRP